MTLSSPFGRKIARTLLSRILYVKYWYSKTSAFDAIEELMLCIPVKYRYSKTTLTQHPAPEASFVYLLNTGTLKQGARGHSPADRFVYLLNTGTLKPQNQVFW